MQLNKQDEKLLLELLKKYKQGIVSGMYPGTNITFTPSGCRDKVISSLNSGGGSSSSIFPNGVELVTESRDFQASDEGKLLVLINASLTMPVGVSILDNKQLGVLTIFNSSTIEVSPNSELTLYSPNNGQTGEILLLENTIQEGQSKLAPISSFNINGKTALKYLMDNMGSNSLFPNGNEFITSSRDYQASDAGKRLFISGATTVLTMPEISPFVVGDIVGIIPEDVDASFTTEFEGQPIYPLKNGDGANSECVVLIATEINSTIKLFSISTAFILDEVDNKKKTALRFLYEKQQNPNEQIVTLGIVTFADINAAPANTAISINLSSSIPMGYFPVAVGIKLVNSFLQTSPIFCELRIKVGTASSHVMGELLDLYSGVKLTETTNSPMSKPAVQLQDYIELNFDNGNSEVNPQDYTAGEFEVYAICKKYPF